MLYYLRSDIPNYALLVGAAMFCHIPTSATSSKTRKALMATVPALGIFIRVGAILECLMWVVILVKPLHRPRVGGLQCDSVLHIPPAAHHF